MKKPFKRVIPENISIDQLTPLDITCGATKCSEGFHCFSLKKSSLRKYGETHVCHECGINLIDWNRIHKLDINEAPYIFNSLKTELIRHVVWHTEIDPEALSKALERGRIRTKDRVKHLLQAKLGKIKEGFDGRQTPKGGKELINYAQHATATCCRKCLEVWHNIPTEATLTEKNYDYLTELIMLFINEKLPKLTEDGIKKE